MTHRVLVTGGAGLVGSHLVDRLVALGDHVTVVDDFSTGRAENLAHHARDRRVFVVEQDVAEPLAGRFDRVYHLACPASPVAYQRDPVRTIRTAVEGTRSVLDLARRTGARVLVASTSEVYGDPEEHPQREGYWGRVNPIGPRACYDEGKRCGEALAASYARQHRVDARIARIFNTYGPRMQPDDGRVISSFAVAALAGEPVTLHGDGAQTRSFCYVSDLVAGLVALMEHAADPGPVNLGNPEEVTIAELARRVIDACGGGAVRSAPRPADDPARRCPDITRAREVLGWRPRVPLADGLVLAIADLRRRLAAAPPRAARDDAPDPAQPASARR